MDLFGSTRTLSLGGKKYGFVIFDDYTRYAWVYFLAHKYFVKEFKMKKAFVFSSIRSNYRTEFENVEFRSFCEKNGVFHNFSSLRSPQQNGVL